MSTSNVPMVIKKAPPPPQKGANRSDRLIKFLSQPLLLEESGPPRVLSQLLIVITVLIGGLIAFAAFTKISETAVTQGQVMPAGSVNLVQHLEGGIVAEILVEDGQVVDQGQTLIRLKKAGPLAEFDQMRAREASLALRAERLRAFVLDRTPDFSAGRDYPDLLADQQAILELQIEARESQRRVLRSRIEQRQAQLDALAEQKQNLKEQTAILKEQLGMRGKLLKKGLVSRVVYLESQRSLSRTQGELASVVGRITETQAALGEAQNSLLELDAKLRNEALDEMGAVTGELAQVREAIAKLEDRVQRLEVSAPTRGVVKGLSTRTIGAVIAPGDPIMEIVPIDDVLVAEVRISPRDVGHLRSGQMAEVKVTTYDMARFGTVEGRLKRVSASTFEDEEGKPFFKGVIELSQAYVGNDPDYNPIRPGMVVHADIITGNKTLLQYLLKPVYRGLSSAFRER